MRTCWWVGGCVRACMRLYVRARVHEREKGGGGGAERQTDRQRDRQTEIMSTELAAVKEIHRRDCMSSAQAEQK